MLFKHEDGQSIKGLGFDSHYHASSFVWFDCGMTGRERALQGEGWEDILANNRGWRLVFTSSEYSTRRVVQAARCAVGTYCNAFVYSLETQHSKVFISNATSGATHS